MNRSQEINKPFVSETTVCCIAMNNYTYTYACRNIFSTIKTSGHSSLEKYIPLTLLKGLCVRGSWRPNKDCNIWTPPSSSDYHSLSFPFSWAAQSGAWRTSSLLRTGSHSSNWNTDFKLWTPTDLNFLSPGLYHCFTPTQFNPTTVKAIPWFPDIFDRMHLLFTLVHFFF